MMTSTEHLTRAAELLAKAKIAATIAQQNCRDGDLMVAAEMPLADLLDIVARAEMHLACAGVSLREPEAA
jgi:hypothetical protein